LLESPAHWAELRQRLRGLLGVLFNVQPQAGGGFVSHGHSRLAGEAGSRPCHRGRTSGPPYTFRDRHVFHRPQTGPECTPHSPPAPIGSAGTTGRMGGPAQLSAAIDNAAIGG